MTLNELKAGDVALIKEIDTKPDTKRRLMDIGLTRGAEIEVLRFAPFGDPVEISVKDFCLALRTSDAKRITVIKLPKAAAERADNLNAVSQENLPHAERADNSNAVYEENLPYAERADKPNAVYEENLPHAERADEPSVASAKNLPRRAGNNRKQDSDARRRVSRFSGAFRRDGRQK